MAIYDILCVTLKQIILNVLFSICVFGNLMFTDDLGTLSLCSAGLQQLLSKCCQYSGDLGIKFNVMIIRCKEVRNIVFPQICLASM